MVHCFWKRNATVCNHWYLNLIFKILSRPMKWDPVDLFLVKMDLLSWVSEVRMYSFILAFVKTFELPNLAFNLQVYWFDKISSSHSCFVIFFSYRFWDRQLSEYGYKSYRIIMSEGQMQLKKKKTSQISLLLQIRKQKG